MSSMPAETPTPAPAPPAPKPEPAVVRARRVREVDFSRPTKFSQEQQRRIFRAHETFCRSAASQLSAELRLPIELEVSGIDQLTWASALSEVPQPSVLGIVNLEPLSTRMMVSIELPAMLRMIERQFGGPATKIEVPERDLTDIEYSIARRVFSSILDQLSVTWDELLGLKLSLIGIESQITSVHLAPTSEPTLSVTVSLAAGVGPERSLVYLVVPYRSIEPVVDRIAFGQYGDEFGHAAGEPKDMAALRDNISAVEVEFRAEVGAVDMTVDEVLALRPGDTVSLGIPASAGVTLCAEDTPLYRCRPGSSGSRRAVEVLERLEGWQ